MMNAPAWQSQRSVPTARPYSSDHFPFDSASPTGAGNGKWIQQVEYSRMLRSMQKGSSDDFVVPSETPATPMWLSSQRNVDLDELSLGILDLHSFDTKLLPEMPVRGAGQGGNAWGRGFDDVQQYFLDSRQIGKACTMPESGLFKGFSADKDKPGTAAKIKVIVHKRPLNKREIAKKKDDITMIEQNSDSLSVHETKLKIDICYEEAYVALNAAPLNQHFDRTWISHLQLLYTCDMNVVIMCNLLTEFLVD